MVAQGYVLQLLDKEFFMLVVAVAALAQIHPL
jgi:hypothetical protein